MVDVWDFITTSHNFITLEYFAAFQISSYHHPSLSLHLFLPHLNTYISLNPGRNILVQNSIVYACQTACCYAPTFLPTFTWAVQKNSIYKSKCYGHFWWCSIYILLCMSQLPLCPHTMWRDRQHSKAANHTVHGVKVQQIGTHHRLVPKEESI